MMMRSHFCGSATLMAGKMAFLLLLIMLFLETPAMGANPVVELSSREELVHMAGYGEEKLSTVTVGGKVFCHVGCVDDHAKQLAQPLVPPAAATPVSGASVAVLCGTSGKSRKPWARGTTDKYGDFLIDLPSHLHAIPNLEKVCQLKLLHLPKNSACRPAFTGKHKGIKLLSIGDGSRAYTANTINLTTKPSKTCKHTLRNRKEMILVY